MPDVVIVPTIKGVLATMESNTTSDGKDVVGIKEREMFCGEN